MMCRKFEVNTLSNSGVITFCDFLSHNSHGYSNYNIYIYDSVYVLIMIFYKVKNFMNALTSKA